MNKERLKHIFEDSACLTARQIKGYVTGKMVHEEAHAVEVHLLSCPFCSDAVEALAEHKAKGAVNVMEKLDAGFMAKHLGVSAQEIGATKNVPPVLKAGSYSTAPETDKPKTVRKLWKPMALAASLLAVLAILWFMRETVFPEENEQLAQTTPAEPTPQPEIAYRPMTDSNTVAYADTTAMQAPEAIADEPVVATAEEPKNPEAAKLMDLKAQKDAVGKPAASQPAAAKGPSTVAAGAQEPVAAMTKPVGPPAAEPLPRMGNSYAAQAADEIKTASEDKPEPLSKESVETVKKKNRDVARTGIGKADDLYNGGKYRRALKIYQNEMGDTRSNKRDLATYMAAKCHLELGEKMQARTLLSSLVSENSARKAQAQQLLNEIGEE